MLMHAIAHGGCTDTVRQSAQGGCTDTVRQSAQGGCTDTVRQSAQGAGSERKVPRRIGDSNSRQYCAWRFSSTAPYVDNPAGAKEKCYQP